MPLAIAHLKYIIPEPGEDCITLLYSFPHDFQQPPTQLNVLGPNFFFFSRHVLGSCSCHHPRVNVDLVDEDDYAAWSSTENKSNCPANKWLFRK